MDWINMFSKSEKLFNDICNLTKDDSFKKTQVVELFALTSLLICRENLGAINVLLKNNLYYEIFMIFRHQIELMFRLNWIITAPDSEEMKKRVNNIEASSFRDYETELDCLKQMGNRTFFSEEDLKKIQVFSDELKQNNPHLIKDCRFMRCVNNAEMAGELREKYYHQFRFLSMLSHPNPLSRDYFLITDDNEDIFRESFEESCKYAMKILNNNLDMIITLLMNSLNNITNIKELQKEFNKVAGK